MRDRSNTISSMTQINTRVEVSVGSMPTLPTTEHFLVSLSFLSEPARRAGEARTGWVQQNNRHAMNRGKQLDPASKITSGPLLPTNHACWVFQAHASTRARCYEHGSSRFFGNHLSRWTCCIGAINASALLVCSTLFLLLQDRPKVGSLMSIAPGDGGSHAYIAAKPALGFLDFGYGESDSHKCVPFAVLANDLSAPFYSKIQLRPWQGQRAIQGTMRPSRNIQLVLRALNQNPVIKSSRVLRCLKVSTINQFCMQSRRSKGTLGFACSLQRSAIVNPGTAIGSTYELSQSFRRWTYQGSALFRLAHSDCAIGVGALEKGRQARQAIRLVAGWEQFQLVGQNYSLRLHTKSVAQTNAPRKNAQTRSRGTIRSEQPLRLRFSGPMKTGLALAHYSGFKGGERCRVTPTPGKPLTVVHVICRAFSVRSMREILETSRTPAPCERNDV